MSRLTALIAHSIKCHSWETHPLLHFNDAHSFLSTHLAHTFCLSHLQNLIQSSKLFESIIFTCPTSFCHVAMQPLSHYTTSEIVRALTTRGPRLAGQKWQAGTAPATGAGHLHHCGTLPHEDAFEPHFPYAPCVIVSAFQHIPPKASNVNVSP